MKAAFVMLLAIAPGLVPEAASSPAPAPAPSAASATAASEIPELREIGRVRVTTPFCRAQLERAGRAVSIVVDGDRGIDETVASLRRADFDSSLIAKQRATGDLRRRFLALHAGALAGNAVMNDFFTAANDAPTPEQKAAMLDFGHALDGALFRQRKLANNMGTLLAYMDAHEPMNDYEAHERHVQAALAANTGFGREPTAQDLLVRMDARLTPVARGAATELETRAQPIGDDERRASDKIEAAFTRC